MLAGTRNSVTFTKAQQAGFEELRAAVEAAMVTPAVAVGAPVDVVDQLRRLAELRDAGVLSPTEFNTTKARLMGGAS